jgi:hypothetical protein
MTCKSVDDQVYKSLMAQRTPYDKENISRYNCTVYNLNYPKSLVNMLSPKDKASFNPSQQVDPNMLYQLNPTAYSLKMAEGASSAKNGYPPSCNYGKHDKGCSQNPNPYYDLSTAYDPMSGSQCINYGQDLNLQYVKN